MLAIIYFLLSIIIDSLILYNTYNWIIPEIFEFMPHISLFSSIALSIFIQYIFSINGCYIRSYKEDENGYSIFMQKASYNLLFLMILFLVKMILLK